MAVKIRQNFMLISNLLTGVKINVPKNFKQKTLGKAAKTKKYSRFA